MVAKLRLHQIIRDGRLHNSINDESVKVADVNTIPTCSIQNMKNDQFTSNAINGLKTYSHMPNHHKSFPIVVGQTSGDKTSNAMCIAKISKDIVIHSENNGIDIESHCDSSMVKEELDKKVDESSSLGDCEDEEECEEERVEGADTARNTNSIQETSPVVRLLLSRANPRCRPATVYFEYPEALNTTRSDVSQYTFRTGELPIILTIPRDKCPLLYTTAWERNCVKRAFAAAGIQRTKKKQSGWHVAWAKHVPRTRFKKFHSPKGTYCSYTLPVTFNHFPDPWCLGRKDRLLETLTSARKNFRAAYTFYPETFTFPGEISHISRNIERDHGEGKRKLWIVKPPASSCGRGIRIITTKQLQSMIQSCRNPQTKKTKLKKCIIQKYIDSPLLLHGRKFDLRLYVLVTSVDPLRIYCFHEGLARVCTAKYSAETAGKNACKFSHLTNYSINKKNPLFVESKSNGYPTEESAEYFANKWSLSSILKHFHEIGIFADPLAIRHAIYDVIVKTIIAAENHLTTLWYQHVNRDTTNCFELFGFDVIIDTTLNVWVLEVNVSPSLMGGSSLDRQIKGLLLSDIFHLAGVQVPLQTLPPDCIPQQLRPINSGRPKSPSYTSAKRINKELVSAVMDRNLPYLTCDQIKLFTNSEWDIIHTMEDELDRCGHFDRIFPTSDLPHTSNLSQYIISPRFATTLCTKWLHPITQRLFKQINTSISI